MYGRVKALAKNLRWCILCRMLKHNTDGMGLPWKEGFWKKARQEGECLIWQAAVLNSGYGVYKPPKDSGWKPQTVQRIAYQLTVGPIPHKTEIKTICGNALCIAPKHLIAKMRLRKKPKPIPRPKKAKPEPKPKLTAEERLWTKVVKTETCWVWTGRIDDHGYGGLKVNGKSISTHRLSYLLHYGEIPPKMLVCHSCNLPACVRPDHLKLGTNKDNTQDMLRAGREPKHYYPPTETEIASILQDYTNGSTIYVLISKYHRSVKAIRKILKLVRSWKID